MGCVWLEVGLGFIGYKQEKNGGDLKMENRKNHADLLQALREYRCGMVRE